MVGDYIRRVDSAAGRQTVEPSDDEVECVTVFDVTVCRLLDALLWVKRSQQLRQTDCMLVSRVVDVDIEISGDDHLTAVGGDDFQQRRQFFKEMIRHRFTAR